MNGEELRRLDHKTLLARLADTVKLAQGMLLVHTDVPASAGSPLLSIGDFDIYPRFETPNEKP